MKIVLFEVEYCWVRRAGKDWRGRRFGRKLMFDMFVVLATSRQLAVRAYLRCTKHDYKRKLLKCERLTGINRSRQLFVLDSKFTIIPGWTEEAVMRKVKSVAPTMVNNAVRLGLLSKPRWCSNCGSGRFVEGHHEDYNKPLSVRWLCRSCHRKVHNDANARKETL